MTNTHERCHLFESDWLGVSTPPPRHRIEQSGWKVDQPQKTGSVFCNHCGRAVGDHLLPLSKNTCQACYNKRLPWLSVTRLGTYKDPLRRWIHDVKFRRDDAMGTTLGRMLGQSVIDAGYGEEVDIVVPMPSTFRRRLRRGIDHAAIITAAVASVLRRPMIRAIRKSARPPQRAVSGIQRPSNVAGSIHSARLSSVSGSRILLVDDIATTQASINEATKVLRKKCNTHSVRVAVLAVTDEQHTNNLQHT